MGLHLAPKNIQYYYAELPEFKKLEIDGGNGDAIEYIENPSEELKLASVKQNSLCIIFIKDPSEKVQLAVCYSKP